MPQLLDATAKGMYAIAATPFTDTGEIDWTSIDPLVDFYMQCRVDCLTVLGMMAEALKLSESESSQVSGRCLSRLTGWISVLRGVLNQGTSNRVELSKQAMDAGACGVMIAPLTGLKTEASIIAYFDEVIVALGEQIPVVYQDYPQSSQANISTAGVLKIIDAHPSVGMFKHEDCPGLKKLSQLRKACDGANRR